MPRAVIALLFTATFISCAPAKEEKTTPVVDTTPWIEPEFPFFSSVLDIRDASAGLPENNLVPRGLILSLGNNLWTCFDTDLLRLACIWQGESGQPPVTTDALAPGSYQVAGQKTKDGQEHLTKPIGRLLLANGIYSGWQILPSASATPTFTDPRPAPFTATEVGRGPLPVEQGQLTSLRTSSRGVVVKFKVAGIDINAIFPNQHAPLPKAGAIYEIPAHSQPFALLLGKAPKLEETKPTPAKGEKGKPAAPPPPPLAPPTFALSPISGDGPALKHTEDGEIYVLIPPSTEWQSFRVDISLSESSTAKAKPEAKDTFHEGTRWDTPIPLTTIGKLSTKTDAAYVTDEIPLPPNPWHRKLRIADLAFLDDQGNAAAVTFDGDIWLVSGLHHDLTNVTWKRYTSGLHEPMNIAVRGKDLFVFDRNGIWKILDQDGNGEAETHELFCNLFTQTAETREFPNSMKLGPDGSFYLAKGGQQGTTIGKDNGTVLRVAPDGKSYTVIGYGLRQPFIGVHPKTGLITASDQQGNYVPSTPFHIIRDHHYYGFLSDLLPEEKYPETIAEPISWIPHPVNPSGASQVWLTGAKMGELNDECIHIGYNRPELFRVLLDDPANPTRATVVPFTRDLNLPPLNGAVNPADGQLYIAGFQVWGTTAKQLSGLDRIRYTGKSRILLKDCTPTDKGLLLRFNLPLDPTTATNLASYNVERWNYQRTPKYGSPHLKLDGQPGQEWMQPSSAYLSKDGKSIFVGLPEMKTIMQMRIGWALKGTDGLPAQNSAYFTPANLSTFDPVKAGFGEIQVDLTPKAAVVAAVAEKPTAEQGHRIAEMFGCMACHSIDGSVIGKVGPSWKGLFKSKRTLKDGKTELRADDEYLHESIINPNAKVVKGYEKFDTGMPIYAGILSEAQIQSLILYIKTL